MSGHTEQEKHPSFAEWTKQRQAEHDNFLRGALQRVEEGKQAYGIVLMLGAIAGHLLEANMLTHAVRERAAQTCGDPNCTKPQCMQMRLMKRLDEDLKGGEEWRHDS